MDEFIVGAPCLSEADQQHLGHVLATAYLTLDPISSDHLNELIQILTEVFEARDAAEAQFRTDFLNMTKPLRNFAMSLARDPDVADDLVQDTLMKAWRNRSSFVLGTNLGAWLFTIMRNSFYSRYRRRCHEVQDTDGVHAANLATLPEQLGNLDLKDVQAALMQLKPAMREALVLVALENLSYEEAAFVMNCQVGTVKSRVWRARDELAFRLGYDRNNIGTDGAMLSALGAQL